MLVNACRRLRHGSIDSVDTRWSSAIRRNRIMPLGPTRPACFFPSLYSPTCIPPILGGVNAPHVPRRPKSPRRVEAPPIVGLDLRNQSAALIRTGMQAADHAPRNWYPVARNPVEHHLLADLVVGACFLRSAISIIILYGTSSRLPPFAGLWNAPVVPQPNLSSTNNHQHDHIDTVKYHTEKDVSKREGSKVLPADAANLRDSGAADSSEA